MLRIITRLLFGLLLIATVKSQSLYQGPAAGSVPSGVVVSTGTFSFADLPVPPEPRIIKNKEPMVEEEIFLTFTAPYPEPLERYVDDPPVEEAGQESRSGMLLQNFHGIGATNSYPPDPHIAAGPEEIVGVVNSVFKIWDKQGNEIKTISAASFYGSVQPRVSPFDPKVFYDHFAKRWIMVWLNLEETSAQYLLSVSDDSTAEGLWYNWSLPSHVNGMTPANNWGDYQGVGFDEEAIYLSSNQFGFSSGYNYVKIRIIPKAQLLQNDAGPVNWFDLWDIRLPGQPNRRVFNIRPSIHYSPSPKYHLLHIPSGGGNFVSLYSITDPTTTPVLSGENIQVLTYQSAPSAGQPGSNSANIEAGGSALLNEPTFRDGSLYAVHSVRNPSYSSFSAIHYMQLNTDSLTSEEDFIYGAENFWHFYPAVAVDKYGNSALTFSRSGNTEYASAYFTGRLDGDPPGFIGSNPLITGRTVYELGNPRNRWGDYLGIAIEPNAEETFWILSEYAKGSSTWDTQVGELRMEPLSGFFLVSLEDSLGFQPVAVGERTDTQKVHLTNYGEDPVSIINIDTHNDNVYLSADRSFPVSLETYDTLTIEVHAHINTPGQLIDTLIVNSDDILFNNILLRFEGFELIDPAANILYAASGNNGNVYIIDQTDASAQLIGESGLDGLDQLLIENLTNGTLFGWKKKNLQPIEQYRISTGNGAAYYFNNLEPVNLSAVITDIYSKQYAVSRLGKLYTGYIRYNDLRLLGTLPTWVQDIAFDRVSESFYAVPYKFPAGATDKIVQFSPVSLDTALVFDGGLDGKIMNFVFNLDGLVYAVVEKADTTQYLYTIDLNSGTFTEVGTLGIGNVTSLAMIPALVLGTEDEKNQIPQDFYLSQNYPNPFNPSTKIDYRLPESGSVSLKIYSLLGEVMAVPVNGVQEAGMYSVTLDALSLGLSSGVYFYELRFENENRKQFREQRKMILLK